MSAERTLVERGVCDQGHRSSQTLPMRVLSSARPAHGPGQPIRRRHMSVIIRCEVCGHDHYSYDPCWECPDGHVCRKDRRTPDEQIAALRRSVARSREVPYEPRCVVCGAGVSEAGLCHDGCGHRFPAAPASQGGTP